MRHCPVCQSIYSHRLHTQNFCLPDGHPLASGYDVVCCDSCGMVFADVDASQADYDRYYATRSKYATRATATGVADSGADCERYAEIIDGVKHRIETPRGWLSEVLSARILDIGCGNGGLLRAFERAGFQNLFGLDPSPVCAANAKSKRISTCHGTLSNLPFTGRFDCVILSHVLEHVLDTRGALSAIREILNPDGLLYTEVPDASRYADCIVAPFQDFNTEHVNHFSHGCLWRLGVESGFRLRMLIEKNIGAYPALASFWMPLAATDGVWSHDKELERSIRLYIDRSAAIMDSIRAQLASLTAPVIVWGAGEFARKILCEKFDVAGIVDSNEIHHGEVLRGVTVAAPSSLVSSATPILIATMLHADEIERQIRAMELTNPIIKPPP